MGKLDNAKYFLRIKLEESYDPLFVVYTNTLDLLPGTFVFLDVGSVDAPWGIPLLEREPLDWLRSDLYWHIESDNPRCLVQWQELLTGVVVFDD
jgi:hypothetical protein